MVKTFVALLTIAALGLLAAPAPLAAQPVVSLSSGVVQQSDLPIEAARLNIDVAASSGSNLIDGRIFINGEDLTGALVAMANRLQVSEDGRSILLNSTIGVGEVLMFQSAGANPRSFDIEVVVSDGAGETRLTARHLLDEALPLSGDAEPASPPAGITTNEIAFTVLAESPGGGLPAPLAHAEPRNVVIGYADSLRRLYDEIFAANGPVEPPAVDFEAQRVIGVLLGERPSAGFGVEIVSVEDVEGNLAVQFRQSQPAADDLVAQVITYPF